MNTLEKTLPFAAFGALAVTGRVMRSLASAVELEAPIAVQKPHRVAFGAVPGENRGDKPFLPLRYRDDPWFWLRDDDRKDEEILDHLKKENAYTEAKTSHLAAFKKKLYDEHISHLKETDERPAYPHGDFFYYTKTVKGKSYKIHCRKRASSLAAFQVSGDAAEEILLDENKVADGHAQCVVQGVKVSPDHTKLAYSVDYKGDETYTVMIVDLKTGETSSDNVTGVAHGIQWGKDQSSFFYLSQDEAKRAHKLWKHVVGTAQSKDVCLFTEDDEVFGLGHGKSKDGRYLFLGTYSSETSELWLCDLDADNAELVVIEPRVKGHRYDAEHREGSLIITTNTDGAVNNRLMITTMDKLGKANWKEIIPYDPARNIESCEVFKSFLAIEGRMGGLTQIWTMNMTPTGDVDGSTFHKVAWPEPMYECALSTNKVYDTPVVRIYYSSLTTPAKWEDYNCSIGFNAKTEKEMPTEQEHLESFSLVKQSEVLNFNKSDYVCKKIEATANDGTKIPMSVVHRKDVVLGGGDTPTMLYGYGSYGICIDPCFHKMILPYLDRGMVYVIAHIRGGGEMGRPWYEEQGKYLNKRNTFTDFINCAEHLIDVEKWTCPEKLAMEGRSAGGLLVGSVLNMRPDLFQIAVAGVPFVDCVTTMCDPSIPLTTGEWEEWGNPNEGKYFDYMLSYSPLDNVREQPYPNILVTSGLHDPRVAYWEPAKWVSKLRTMKTDKNEVLLKMDIESGHFSASDRYKYIREKSFEQSVVMDYLGMVDKEASKL